MTGKRKKQKKNQMWKNKVKISSWVIRSSLIVLNSLITKWMPNCSNLDRRCTLSK